MSQYLPYSGFKWLNQIEISDFRLNSTSENSSIGYILEINLEYPSELHELHDDYPLAPGKLEISQNRLSNYCISIANEYGIKIGGVNKLVPNLGNTNKYVVHYRNLQLYLSLRIKLTKIHIILKFKQSNKRRNAANSFEKDFFKLMNNSVFGKTMENIRKRISVKLVNDAKDYVRCINKPSFVSQKIFSKNFIAIYEMKPVLTLNKPVYAGFNILDLSKLLMFEFHHKFIKSKFDAKLLFTYTERLVYEIKAEDVYEDFYQDKNLFDFSDYPLNSKFFDPVNKKVIGKMKYGFKRKMIKVRDVLINWCR